MMDDEGVTPVLGTLLMTGMMMTMIPVGFMLMGDIMDAMDAQSEWANAEAERARFYADCARAHSSLTEDPHPECPDEDDLDDGLGLPTDSSTIQG